MKRIILSIAMLVAASFIFTSCGAPAANNAPANRPANVAANTAVASAADITAAEAEIKKLRETAEAALGKNDADAMEKIYADNYMLVNVDGSVQNKAERLASLRSGDTKYTSFAYGEANTRVNAEGTGAIVIGKLSMKGTARGKPIDGEYRVTQVYAKTRDGWKQVGAQATKIEGGAQPAKADDKAKMNEAQKATGNAKIDAMAADDVPPPKKK